MKNLKKIRSVLCIAAASSEYKSIKSYLDSAFGSGRIIPLSKSEDFAIEYTDPANSVVWNLAGLAFQGQTEITVASAKFVELLKPTITMLVGMCMGMPARRYSPGTVVIPNEVFSFDHTRVTQKGTQIRPHAANVSTELHKLAKIVASSNEFSFKIVEDKGLASASSKIEYVSASLIKFIERSFPDAAAYDMEGWGFYSSMKGEKSIWIKAVADSGEAQSHDIEGQSAKQEVQQDVTKNAIAFGISLVRTYYKIYLDQSPRKPSNKKSSNHSSEAGPFAFQVAEEKAEYTVQMRSIHMDVIKIHAHTHMIGVAAEYAWIRENYGDFELDHQTLSTLELLTGKEKEYTSQQIHFDVLTGTLSDGRTKEFYFDISDFYWPGLYSEKFDANSFAARKLSEIYSDKKQ